MLLNCFLLLWLHLLDGDYYYTVIIISSCSWDSGGSRINAEGPKGLIVNTLAVCVCAFQGGGQQ